MVELEEKTELTVCLRLEREEDEVGEEGEGIEGMEEGVFASQFSASSKQTLFEQ